MKLKRKGNSMVEIRQRVYISGPISGVKEYKNNFLEAETELLSKGYAVVNPARLDGVLPEGLSYEEHKKVDLSLLDICDCIYMIDGWKNSPGANREYGYALASGKEIMLQGVGV